MVNFTRLFHNMKMESKSPYRFAGIGFVLVLILSACGGEQGALKEEKLYFNQLHAGWITSDTINDIFIMTDNNKISQSFVMRSDTYYFNKGWSSFLGINTSMTYTEYHYQAYTSGFGMRYSFSLTAGSPPYGDVVFVSLNDVGFQYDLEFETVFGLDTPFAYKSYLITSEGYEVHDDGEIFSSVEILDSLVTSYESYEEVLHFTFNDFNDQWTDLTITEIFLAKEVGLVKYVLAGGVSAERSIEH